MSLVLPDARRSVPQAASWYARIQRNPQHPPPHGIRHPASLNPQNFLSKPINLAKPSLRLVEFVAAAFSFCFRLPLFCFWRNFSCRLVPGFRLPLSLSPSVLSL